MELPSSGTMSMPNKSTISRAINELLTLGSLPKKLRLQVKLELGPRRLASSFCIAEAATATIAASGLAATALWELRGGEPQTVSVHSRHAETAFQSEHLLQIAGQPQPNLWAPLSGVYQCADQHQVRIHANYPHHAARLVELLNCEPDRATVEHTLKSWRAIELEDACAASGAIGYWLRTPDQWAKQPQADALAAQSLFDIESIGPAPIENLPPLAGQPLAGVRVLDLTRMIAGPVGGRTLAMHGADVLRISARCLAPDPVTLDIDGGRGKRSAFIDIKTSAGQKKLMELVDTADVFIQGYRPGAVEAHGFSAMELAKRRPGIVVVSLSAWGDKGPWAPRRGFDSIVQTATGINWAEGQANSGGAPQALPCQALDHGSGYLVALGAMAGLYRRATQGGSWHVRIGLARTGRWLQSLGRVNDGFAPRSMAEDDRANFLTSIPTSGGTTTVTSHPAVLSRTPAIDDHPPQAYPGNER